MEITDLFKFDKFVSPVLVKIVYWIGLVLIVLSTLVGIAGSSLVSSYLGGGGFSVGGALVSIITGAFAFLVWRVICEVTIVVFAISGHLATLVELKQAETGK